MFSSLYPSIMAEFNIAPNTQIGKILIPNKVFKNEDYYNLGKLYSRSGEFIENMVCDNMIEFMHRWFHTATFEELLEDLDEYFKNSFDKTYSEVNDNPNNPFNYNPAFKSDPLVINENDHIHNPFIFRNKRPEELNYNKIITERKHEDVYS